ncbi:MAG: hypothetical protein V2I36_14045 [Desulfopila sp.]|nr:hypothetical protein [Desulfopila sp.]
MKPMYTPSNPAPSIAAPPVLSGYCSSCDAFHSLQISNAKQHGKALMTYLEQEQRLDFLSNHSPNPACSTTHLFDPAGGKMFGVLEGIDQTGNICLLYAFSGQFNGLWNISGWAPPLFNEEEWHQTNSSIEKQIKKLGRLLDRQKHHSHSRKRLIQERKQLSQQLMTKLHSLYRLRNFRGQTASLAPFFSERKGIPTGAGDCCAPKLLNSAIEKNITPVGIAEFYWGESNPSKTRRHGYFYPACIDKCTPLMGFLLCGLAERQHKLETGL